MPSSISCCSEPLTSGPSLAGLVAKPAVITHFFLAVGANAIFFRSSWHDPTSKFGPTRQNPRGLFPVCLFCRPPQHGQVSSGQEVVPSGWKVWVLRPHSMSFMPTRVASARPGLQNKKSQCHLILAFPEDPGGDVVDGPASIWSCHEWQMLERLHEAERGAAFGSSPRRITEDPGGSSPSNLLARLWPGWPSLQLSHSQLVYTGPLPKSCRCVTQSETGASVLICSLFWQRCLFD